MTISVHHRFVSGYADDSDSTLVLIYSLSVDGVHFLQVISESRTAFMAGGPNNVGLAVDNNNGTYLIQLSCDWFRRTL